MKRTLLTTLGLLFVAGSASAQGLTASATAAVNLEVQPGISIEGGGTVSFGNIVQGQGLVELDHNGMVSSGIAGMPNSGTAASFTVGGYGNAVFTVSAPAVNLTRAGGGAITFTPTLYDSAGNEITTNPSLDGGTFEVIVGGSVTVPDAQETGSYTGTVTLNVAYVST